jgi:hypothetical protein
MILAVGSGASPWYSESAAAIYCGVLERRPPVKVEELSGIELRDSDGEFRRLGDFWAQRRVVLVFARHFG